MRFTAGQASASRAPPDTSGAAPRAVSPPSRWIVGPVADLFWVVACPVLCFAALQALWSWGGVSDNALYAVMFAFVVTAHHMPAALRAFGEPAIYQRYKARLWTAALAMPLLAVVPAVFGFGMLALCVIAIFDLWHVAMQQHGIGRIYGAKAGDSSPRSARLDLTCMLSLYGAVVLWSDSWMAGLAQALRGAGLQLFSALSPGAFSTLRQLWLWVCLALLALYVQRAWSSARKQGTRPWLKYLAHAVAFGILFVSYQERSWFRAQSSQNAFHALQYFFLVWVYGHLAVRRAPLQHPPFYEGLFGPRRGILRFAILVALYGLLFYLIRVARGAVQAHLIEPAQLPLIPTTLGADRTVDVLASLGVASLFLHFYLDSFIWKVRSRSVRATLSIAAPAPPVGTGPGGARDVPEPTLRGIAHGLGYFGIPLVLVAVLGAGRRSPSPAETLVALQHEAQLFDESAAAHDAYARAALASGDRRTAHAELQRAAQLAPSFLGPAAGLFDMAYTAADHAQAVKWGTLAVAADPLDGRLRGELASELLATGQTDLAVTQVEASLALPDLGFSSLALGQLLLREGKMGEAIQELQRAQRGRPDDGEVAYALSEALRKASNPAEARAVAAAYVHRHPGTPTSAGFLLPVSTKRAP